MLSRSASCGQSAHPTTHGSRIALGAVISAIVLSTLAVHQWSSVVLLQRKVMDPVYEYRWRLAEERKAAMPRYSLPTAYRGHAGPLPVWVVSIPRLKERRQHLAQCMSRQGVKFEFIHGVDGNEALPEPFASVYSSRRWQRLVREGDRLKTLKLSNQLSVLLVMYKLVAERLPLAVVVEDDICISAPGWMTAIKQSLEQLPVDWDILYLSATSPTLGPFVGNTSRLVRKTAGTTCFVINQRTAFKVLERAKGADDYIDKVLFHMEWRHQLQAYLTQPPLCDVEFFHSSLSEDKQPGHRNATRPLAPRRLLLEI